MPIDTSLNRSGSPLAGVDCPICANKGYTLRVDTDGILLSKECDCMAKRRTLSHIRKSGLEQLVSDCDFEGYIHTTEDTERVYTAFKRYCEQTNGLDKWIYICGKPGSGKTHICVAACKALMEQGNEVHYMLWREAVPNIKSAVNDSAKYNALMKPLKTVDVLYIDDFLKGHVTDADIQLAFELLNNRYNSHKRTIISSEMDVEQVLKYDEALGSRIIERSRGYIIKSPTINARLKGLPDEAD